MDRTKPRVTTAEAAARLKCEPLCALQLLKAASVPCSRMAPHGPYLWDSEGVERLLIAIRPEAQEGGGHEAV